MTNVGNGTGLDTCPSCGWTQANINNPGYLNLLRPVQRPRHACMNCGWRAA
jgi:predicted RNA-binding Zn-ribbon protein involved in translation (DUF1610 family)